MSLITLLAVLSVTVVPARGEGESVPDTAPVVVVGGDRGYPPYEFLDEEGQPSGFNVELTRAIARVMGMEVEVRLGAWSEMRRALARGEVDILQGMVPSKERAAEVDF
ncbi:MAG TPA: transporter substrate-binding domain-containing protein, partial [Desulfuromonadales bacterium]